MREMVEHWKKVWDESKTDDFNPSGCRAYETLLKALGYDIRLKSSLLCLYIYIFYCFWPCTLEYVNKQNIHTYKCISTWDIQKVWGVVLTNQWAYVRHWTFFVLFLQVVPHHVLISWCSQGRNLHSLSAIWPTWIEYVEIYTLCQRFGQPELNMLKSTLSVNDLANLN